MESSRCKDVNLDSRAIECRIGSRGRAMENQDREMCQLRISRVVEVDLLLRKRRLLRDSNHREFFEGRGLVGVIQWATLIAKDLKSLGFN